MIGDKERSELAGRKIKGLGPKQDYIPLKTEESYQDHPHPLIENTLTYYLAKALKKERKVPSRLMSYMIYSENPNEFLNWLFDASGLEEIKKKIQNDPKFLENIQTYITGMKKNNVNEAEGINVYYWLHPENSKHDNLDSHQEYIRMKQKSESLENDLKKQLTEMINSLKKNSLPKGKKEKAGKPPKIPEKIFLPTQIEDFAENYLKNQSTFFPCFEINSKNANISSMCKVMKRILANVIEVEIKRSSTNEQIKLPDDIEIENVLDQYILKRQIGKGLIGPVENKIVPMFQFFIGPILHNQLYVLLGDFRNITKLMTILSEKKEVSKEEMIALQELLISIKLESEACSAMRNSKKWVFNLPLESLESHNEKIPDLAEIKKVFDKNPNLVGIQKEMLDSLLSNYKENSEYINFLQGTLIKIEETFCLSPDLLGDLMESVSGSMPMNLDESELKSSLSAFNQAWNHYYSLYKSKEYHLDQGQTIAKIKEILGKQRKNNSIQLINDALAYPQIVNTQALLQFIEEKPEGSKIDIGTSKQTKFFRCLEIRQYVKFA